MKGIFCAECFDIKTLRPGNNEPVSCECGNTTGWWLDGSRGVARYTAKRPAYAWGMGFTNTVLTGVRDLYGSMPADEEWRDLFDKATTAPGYYFDKSKHGSWAIFFKPGRARDVEWASNEERAAVGLPPYPAGHALAPKAPDQGQPEGSA